MEMEDEAGNPWYKQMEREERINHGINGSHLVMPFQCECCWFRVLEGRTPEPGDNLMMACIRRVNLDAMTGKSRHTVHSHLGRTKRILKINERFRKTPSLKPRGPLPTFDFAGMGVALDMVMYSLAATGRNATYVQFDTLRQIRSTATKNYDSSPQGVLEQTCFHRGTGQVRLTNCPTQSEFFSDFLKGCEYRMGAQPKANLAVSIRVIKELLRRVEEDIQSLDDGREKNDLFKFGAFIAMCTGASLRGNECFMADLAGLIRHIDRGRNGVVPEELKEDFQEEVAEALPHVVVSLLGRVKGETGEDTHLIGVANVTKSGIKIRWWIEQLIRVAKKEKRQFGPAFATPDGRLIPSSEYNAIFLKYLEDIQASTDLIEQKLIVRESFGISRTLRKSAEARVTRAGLPASLQDKMNRWRTIETADGRNPKFQMRDLYAGVLAQMPTTWRYSYAL